ncbi:OTU domain-containing protein 6B [Xylariaceae sp. FL1019]|nr:OTU domain-containing protein 6B [Xylariaceae sp. FL1019]
METETLEAMQARHRKEARDLQSRITSKKKNASKKTRKGVNDECEFLERELKERQEREIEGLDGDEPELDGNPTDDADGEVTDTKTDDITEQLKETVISSPAQQQPQTQPQTQAQAPEGGKKRNRQKERMARRAAEQEAAVDAAADEARGMTDHRTLERSGLEEAFTKNGLVEFEIRPDGHCLFAAVADQLMQCGVELVPPSGSGAEGVEDEKVPPYRAVRRVATKYMQDHPDDFAPFLEEPLEAYVSKIRDTAEWGGQLELSAIARVYGVRVRVVQSGRIENIEPGGGDGEGDGEKDGKDGEKMIWLAYYRHGYGLGEHYNSLRVKG